MGTTASIVCTNGRCQPVKPGSILGVHAYHIVPSRDCYSSWIKYRYKWYSRYDLVRGNSVNALGCGRGADINGHDSCSPEPQETSPRLKFKYLAEISYDGTEYNGFQLQPRCPTIQGSIERALKNYCGLPRQELVVQGAARTDAGVHARQQFVEFYSERALHQEAFVRSLNRMVPSSIAVRSLRHVEHSFNVRYSQGKIYSYDIHLGPVRDPFACRYRHVPLHPEKLDIDAIKQATSLFVGTKDFRLLTNASGDDRRTIERSTIRHMYNVDVGYIKDGARIVVMGKGFLYKQVRNMAGVLLAVAAGTMSLEDVEILLQGNDDALVASRQKSKYKVAEAKGLTLQRVFLQNDSIPNDITNTFDLILPY